MRTMLLVLILALALTSGRVGASPHDAVARVALHEGSPMQSTLSMGTTRDFRVHRKAEERDTYWARTGRPRLDLVKSDAWLLELLRQYEPRTDIGRFVHDLIQDPESITAERLAAGLEMLATVALLPTTELSVSHFDAERHIWTDYGVVSRHTVTTAGVNYIAARMANSSPSNISLLNFHGIGTGATAAAIGDTTLQTELTTQYNPDSTRATGTQSNPSANVYRSLATNLVDATVAITEHGIFSQSATGGGTLLDRFVFSAINLASGDSLQTTFDLTMATGG